MTGILHIVVARKPIEGTIAENCLKHGIGAINVDGCRIGTESVTTHSRGVNGAFPKRPIEKSAEESGRKQDQRLGLDLNSERKGRWPANLMLDDSPEVQENFPESDHARGNIGESKGGGGMYGHGKCKNSFGSGDSGNTSRFFFNFSEQESTE